MLTVTETVLLALGAGFIAFLLVPCCAYWFKCCDVDRFRRPDPPLQTLAII